jgi:hypothetical protein
MRENEEEEEGETQVLCIAGDTEKSRGRGRCRGDRTGRVEALGRIVVLEEHGVCE